MWQCNSIRDVAHVTCNVWDVDIFEYTKWFSCFRAGQIVILEFPERREGFILSVLDPQRRGVYLASDGVPERRGVYLASDIPRKERGLPCQWWTQKGEGFTLPVMESQKGEGLPCHLASDGPRKERGLPCQWWTQKGEGFTLPVMDPERRGVYLARNCVPLFKWGGGVTLPVIYRKERGYLASDIPRKERGLPCQWWSPRKERGYLASDIPRKERGLPCQWWTQKGEGFTLPVMDRVNKLKFNSTKSNTSCGGFARDSFHGNQPLLVRTWEVHCSILTVIILNNLYFKITPQLSGWREGVGGQSAIP